jgi:hypothetical protein
MERQHRHLLVFTVGTAQLALPAVVQRGVGAVPALDDLQALVDLAAELLRRQVVGDERGAHRLAQLLQGLVRGVLGATPAEAAQHLLGLGHAEAEGGGVLDQLVVVTPMSSQSMQRAVMTGSSCGHDMPSPMPRRLSRAAPMRLSLGSRLKPSRYEKANATRDAPWVST